MQTITKNKRLMLVLSLCGLLLVACDSKNKSASQSPAEEGLTQQDQAEVLPFLNLEEAKAKYALPFCEKKNCIEIEIQSIQTQDAWLNRWMSDSQAIVIQDQIGLKQAMSLQQAINAYVKKSDAWQAQFAKNKAYELHVQTRIAAQRNQYVLLQVIINSKQEEVTVKDRGYFFVADRKAQKKLGILDVINAKQQNVMNDIVQVQYAKWLADQTAEVKKVAPKKLYWGQNDWFFDGEGIGVHFRASEIVKDGTQMDLYLTKQQTQQILKPEIFQQLFYGVVHVDTRLSN